MPWMQNNVIGQFIVDLDFEQLCEEVVKGGINIVRVWYMGDNLALLTPR